MTGNRSEALARLDVFVGEWVVEARFPGQPAPPGAAGYGPVARSWFEWALGRQFLLQRTEVPVPEAPDGLMIVGADPESGGYTQHYYDSRGVARVYQMSLAAGVWKVWRDAPGFWQRYTGLISADGTSVTGAWEYSPDGVSWRHDFSLTYLAAARPASPPNNQNR